MDAEYSGLTTDKANLRVHMTIREGGWIKFCVVDVPLEDLLDKRVTDAMDRTVRRELIQIWSEVDLADPLF